MRDAKSIELWATGPVSIEILKRWLTFKNERAELLRQTIGLGRRDIPDQRVRSRQASCRCTAIGYHRIKGRFRVSECVQ
jgi:hypothetical protein